MSIKFIALLSLLLTLSSWALLSGCAYRLGRGTRSVPGGYKTVSIPIFKNRSYETGVEVSFTNALLKEFERSHVAHVVDDSLSEVRIEGEITDLRYFPGANRVAGDPAAPYLPKGTVLTTDYTISVTTKIRVIRRADSIEIWAGNFNKERTYSSPVVTIAGLNSVDPLYNLSARRLVIDGMAIDSMAEAHNSLTESF